MLKSNLVDWGPKPFGFLDIWQEDKNFGSFVRSKWESYLVKGNMFQTLKDKLKMLKSDLKWWNKEVFGYTNKIKLDIMNRNQEIDLLGDVDNLDENMIKERREILSQLHVINMRSEVILQQKSKGLWFKQGYSNSKYFHAIIR